MPYNNTPIAPPTEITGTVALPLARVKKIIQADADISSCSNNAAFVLTVAAELFLQHLVEQAYTIVKAERKPRRNVQYRDIASAVARVENLEFLADVVPKTTTWKVHRARVAKEGSGGDEVNGAAIPAAAAVVVQDEAEDEEAQATNGASHDVMEVDDEVAGSVAGEASRPESSAQDVANDAL